MKKVMIILFMVVLLCTPALGDREQERERERERERRRHEGGERRFEDLEPRRPKQQFKSEGGQIEEWNSDEFRSLQDANVAAAKITLNPRGLTLPSYIDNHAIHVVVEGSARLGLVLPFGDRAIERNVYRVQKGDLVAVPRGVPAWWYNDGDKRTEIVVISDTLRGEERGRVQAFHLAGARNRQNGSVLGGFDRKILARAWDVDEQTVARILDSQKETAIVRVSKGIDIPEVSEGNTFFADFVYRLGRSQADFRAERGGQLYVVNRHKLPVLRDLDLSITAVKLEPNALCAPAWVVNAHQIIYFIRGSGRIQVVRSNGEKGLDAEVREGSIVIVPQFFPVSKIAGRDGLDYVSVLTSDVPLFQFLAGRNSVFNGIPTEVLAGAFNVEEELERKVLDRRSEEAIIFPPDRSEKRDRRRRPYEREPRDTSFEDDASASSFLDILGF